MTDYIIGGVLEYVTAVLGVQFDEVAAMAPAQVVLLLLGAVVVLFALLFIMRAVLGGSMYMFR